MKIKSSIKTLTVAFLLTLGLTACEKGDEYIDWKVMNDEWLTTHREDVDIVKSMNWLETNDDIYKKSTVPFKISKSGLSYRFIRRANEAERTPNPTSRIYATYEGKYIDGTTFDKGKKVNLSQLNGLIQGHQEILMQMRIGEIVEIIVPNQLGYGEKGQGVIPPYSVLIFRIELTDIIL